MLNVNDKIPNAALLDINGNKFELSELGGSKAVIYFYPKDCTSGCVKHALGFKNIYDEFKNRNIRVVGISKDNVNSHKRFIEKYELPFELLTDSELNAAKLYGAVKMKKRSDGGEALAIERTTFVIDEKGAIISILRNIKPELIAERVLEEVLNHG